MESPCHRPASRENVNKASQRQGNGLVNSCEGFYNDPSANFRTSGAWLAGTAAMYVIIEDGSRNTVSRRGRGKARLSRGAGRLQPGVRSCGCSIKTKAIPASANRWSRAPGRRRSGRPSVTKLYIQHFRRRKTTPPQGPSAAVHVCEDPEDCDSLKPACVFRSRRGLSRHSPNPLQIRPGTRWKSRNLRVTTMAACSKGNGAMRKSILANIQLECNQSAIASYCMLRER